MVLEVTSVMFEFLLSSLLSLTNEIIDVQEGSNDGYLINFKQLNYYIEALRVRPPEMKYTVQIKK